MLGARMFKSLVLRGIFLSALGWLWAASVIAETPQQIERVREFRLGAQQWRDTAQGVEYCEGVFRRYNGPNSESRCRVSAGGIAGFIGSMRDGQPMRLAEALVVLNGLSVSTHQAKIIRTREKPSGGLEVTYSLFENVGISNGAVPSKVENSKPVLEKQAKEVPGFVFLISILLVLGLAFLAVAYPLFGPLSVGSGLVIVIIGLFIGGTSNAAVLSIIFFCLVSTTCSFIFCYFKGKREEAQYAAYRETYITNLSSQLTDRVQAPIPSVAEVLGTGRGRESSAAEPAVIAQTDEALNLNVDAACNAPSARRRIVLD